MIFYWRSYSRETKRKFQCDLIHAINKDAKAEINPSDVKCFLENIGASQELNEEELRTALNEIAGDSNGTGVTSTEKLRFFISAWWICYLVQLNIMDLFIFNQYHEFGVFPTTVSQILIESNL